MKRLFILFLIALLNSTILWAGPIKTIRFAVEATYPPFEYIDASGQIKGFDIDLAYALCARIKATCTFTHQTFNSLITSLNLGKFDAIISAISITQERLQKVSFTTPYYEPSACLVAAIGQASNIVGKKIGVQQGTTMEKYINEKYGNQVSIKTYASIQEAFLDLISGRVNFIITDLPIAQTWLKKDNHDKHYGIIGKPIIDPLYFGVGYGIAVRKDDIELLNALNKALAEIKADGTYHTLVKKYF
ncbi:MAG: hypothetical protein A3F42_05325 [Gammaproteobacteria bacterium RIFCSPHIGHO2_12_FULL_37_34]|nr:MAG: hypothetical protein A3F42_05325 [Gammaproteobacteria bacterium RIFCSPHIGHO2_12_FULL_37_34]